MFGITHQLSNIIAMLGELVKISHDLREMAQGYIANQESMQKELDELSRKVDNIPNNVVKRFNI